MYRTGLLVASTAAIVLMATAFVTATTDRDQRAVQDQRDTRVGDERPEEIREGLIVDLHHYLSKDNGDDGEASDREIAGKHTGGPIGLLVKEEGTLITSTNLFVLVFEPDNRGMNLGSAEAPVIDQDTLNDKVGERVRIGGYEMERHGIRAFCAKALLDSEAAEERSRDEY